jgi:hypothetical protein
MLVKPCNVKRCKYPLIFILILTNSFFSFSQIDSSKLFNKTESKLKLYIGPSVNYRINVPYFYSFGDQFSGDQFSGQQKKLVSNLGLGFNLNFAYTLTSKLDAYLESGYILFKNKFDFAILSSSQPIVQESKEFHIPVLLGLKYNKNRLYYCLALGVDNFFKGKSNFISNGITYSNSSLTAHQPNYSNVKYFLISPKIEYQFKSASVSLNYYNTFLPPPHYPGLKNYRNYISLNCLIKIL